MDNSYAIIELLEKAGEILLNYFYQDNLNIKTKQDNSLVSEADLAVNDFLCSELTKLNLTIISEENPLSTNKKIAQQQEFWLLDPLDGSKAFINKEKDFAVCLAHIINNRPNIGFIHIPFSKETYYNKDNRAFVKNANNVTLNIKTNKQLHNIHLLASHRMNNNHIFQNYIKQHNIKNISMASSAIKYCYLAAGQAQLLPYFANIMQWDSAAGDAIIHAAGGRVEDLNGQKLRYGNFNNFINPHFIAYA
jgi:3'(2'), 5'-bisphosphate nucleotidase